MIRFCVLLLLLKFQFSSQLQREMQKIKTQRDALQKQLIKIKNSFLPSVIDINTQFASLPHFDDDDNALNNR